MRVTTGNLCTSIFVQVLRRAQALDVEAHRIRLNVSFTILLTRFEILFSFVAVAPAAK